MTKRFSRVLLIAVSIFALLNWTSLFAAENLEECKALLGKPEFAITRLEGRDPDSLLRGDLVELVDKTDNTLTKGYFLGRLQGYDEKAGSIIILGQKDLTIHLVPGDNVSLKIESGLVPAQVDALLDIDKQWDDTCVANSIINCIYSLKAMNSTQKIVALAATDVKARRDFLLRLVKRLESSGSHERAGTFQQRSFKKWATSNELVYETMPHINIDGVKRIVDALGNRDLVLLGYNGTAHSRQENVFDHGKRKLGHRLLEDFLLPGQRGEEDSHSVLLLGIIHTDRFGDRILVLDSDVGTFILWRSEDLNSLVDTAHAYIVSTSSTMETHIQM